MLPDAFDYFGGSELNVLVYLSWLLLLFFAVVVALLVSGLEGSAADYGRFTTDKPTKKPPSPCVRKAGTHSTANTWQFVDGPPFRLRMLCLVRPPCTVRVMFGS